MVEITAMTIADYEEAMDLWQRTPELGVSPQYDCRERIGIYLERNPGLSTAARADGRLVGTVLCGHDGRKGSIYHVAVDAGFRGQGLAAKMMQRSEAALKAAGIPTGFLFVHTANGNAGEFYKHEGWAPVPNVVYWYKYF